MPGGHEDAEEGAQEKSVVAKRPIVCSSADRISDTLDSRSARFGTGWTVCRFKRFFVEPGSPWKNGYVESFNGNLRDELLSRETFYALMEAKVLVEGWRREHNWIRPHSALGYRPPAHEAIESRSGEGKISVDRHARLG